MFVCVSARARGQNDFYTYSHINPSVNLASQCTNSLHILPPPLPLHAITIILRVYFLRGGVREGRVTKNLIR